MTHISIEKCSVKTLYQSLEYGPAPESPAVVNAWLNDHDRSFGHFIDGQWVKPTGRKTYDSFNPATGEKLATTVQGIGKMNFDILLFFLTRYSRRCR